MINFKHICAETDCPYFGKASPSGCACHIRPLDLLAKSGAKLMQPAELRRIRAKAGLSLDKLAKVLRIEDRSTIHRWEKGDRPISGPASVLLELLDAGELPARYLV